MGQPIIPRLYFIVYGLVQWSMKDTCPGVDLMEIMSLPERMSWELSLWGRGKTEP